MTRSTRIQSSTTATADSEPDFIAHLQARWRLNPDAALATLASWIKSYEPIKPRHIRLLERRPAIRHG